MNDERFSAILGDEYKLLRHAYLHHDEFQSKVAELLAKHVNNWDNTEIKVIEGGSGTGVSTSFLLNADPRVFVIAVDSEIKMLSQAKEVLNDLFLRTEQINRDLLEFCSEQKAGSFDAFVSVWTLHNLQPDYRNRLFGEIYRILRVDGIFISGDKYAVEDEDKHKEMLDMQLSRFKSFGTMGSKELADSWVKHNLEDDEIKMSEFEQVEILRNLGFGNVETGYRKDMEAVISAIKR